MKTMWIADTAGSIQSVEVSKETDKFVTYHNKFWNKPQRQAKHSRHESFFDTWEEAHAHLVQCALDDVHKARARLERANGRLGHIKGMKKPADAADQD